MYYEAAKKMQSIGGSLGYDVRESSRPCCVVLERIVLLLVNRAVRFLFRVCTWREIDVGYATILVS